VVPSSLGVLAEGSLRARRLAAAAAEPARAGVFFLSHDFGKLSSRLTYVCAESPGAEGPDGGWYPRGSVYSWTKCITAEPGTFQRGMGYTVPRVAEEIRELGEALEHFRPDGVADDAIFAKTRQQRRKHCGRYSSDAAVYFRPGEESRPAHRLGSAMRRLLS
jgi:hypothetical protein